MTVISLPANDRHAQTWRNGGGVTFEVARAAHPQRPGEFLWRASIAEVAASGPFSSFVGYARLIAVVAGAGMVLRGLGTTDTLLRPFEVLRFDGAVPVEGLLTQGAVKDFNVIFDPVRCRATLAFVAGSGRHVTSARTAFLVNVETSRCGWRCGADSGTLAPLDALRLDVARGTELEWHGAAHCALVGIDY